MTAILCNGRPVLRGSTITAPRQGAWYADVRTATEVSTGDSVVISDGSTELAGTVAIGGDAVDKSKARIVGGAAGALATLPQAYHWRNAKVGKILGDLCAAMGESKSRSIPRAVTRSQYQFWTQPGGQSGGSAFFSLAESGGWVWGVLQNGTIWIGDPETAISEPEYQTLEPHPESDSYTVAPEGLSLWVGSEQQGLAVQRVEYSLGESLRCTYWL